MLFDLFRSKPPLDEPSVTWLFDVYAWALRNFNAEMFRQSGLITPSNEHFPGRVDSVHGMAELIFNKVKGYAGMTHWPTELLDQNQCPALKGEVPIMPKPWRAKGLSEVKVEHRYIFTYAPELINNPEAMIALYAQNLAHYLGIMCNDELPGGKENWLHGTEVLASFMGFGIIMANTAFNVRIPRCGSCGPAPVDRQSSLSQYDMTYALAIYTQLKAIPSSEVTRHLKSSLRGFFKRAVKDVQRREQELLSLRALMQGAGQAIPAAAQA